MIRHFAYPPPSASSRAIDPDELVSILSPVLSPRVMTDHAQNCFSIIASADASASFLLSFIESSRLVGWLDSKIVKQRKQNGKGREYTYTKSETIMNPKRIKIAWFT